MQKLIHGANSVIDLNVIAGHCDKRVDIQTEDIFEATKKAHSKLIHDSIRISNSFWELLTPILPDAASKETQKLLDAAIYRWLLTIPSNNNLPVNDIPFITGLQFNNAYSLEEMGNVAFAVARNNDNTLSLTIPEFNPAADICSSLNTEPFSFKIMAVSYDINNEIKTGSYITELMMPYNDIQIQSQNIDLPLNAKKGNLIIVAMTVEYAILRNTISPIIRSRRWMPSGIVWAGYN